MKIVIDANWDDEAKVWYAVARGDVGLATEAESLDDLRGHVAVILADLLEEDDDAEADFDLVVHTAIGPEGVVAAE